MTTRPSIEPLLDRIKAAEYLDISPGTLAVWDSTKRHDLQPIRIGRRVKYRRASLDRYIERRMRGE